MRQKATTALALFILGAASSAAPLDAQTRELTATDYNRAEQFLSWNSEKLTRGLQVTPAWLEGDRFWYRTRVLDGHEFVLVDPDAGQRRPAFDHDRLAAALSVAADTSYVGSKLPFTTFEFTDDDQSIRFHVGDSIRWSCGIVTYTCPPPDSIGRPDRHEVHSPDRSKVAFERDEDLWIRDVENGE